MIKKNKQADEQRQGYIRSACAEQSFSMRANHVQPQASHDRQFHFYNSGHDVNDWALTARFDIYSCPLTWLMLWLLRAGVKFKQFRFPWQA